ncbi:MAG: PAS domain-containing protein [Myxococcales bacterium]|nr:PAS domain-containing protein [Myxococcales bacterium]
MTHPPRSPSLPIGPLTEIWQQLRSLCLAEGGKSELPSGADAQPEELLKAALSMIERCREDVGHLQTFFEAAHDGFFFMMLDAPVDWARAGPEEKDSLLDFIFEHQRITRANRAMLDQYGASLEDFIGLTPKDFFEHDMAQGRAAWRELLDAGVLQTRTHEQRLSGEKFWVEGTYVVLTDNQDRIVGHFGTQRDVTAEVEAVNALRKSEERLEEAQRITHIGHWDWDIITNDLYWSREIYRILGREPGDNAARYEDFIETTHADDRERVQAAVAAALAGRPYSVEHRVVRPDGEERWVHERGQVTFDSTGKPLRMLGTAQDITERKRVNSAIERSLHEKEVLLREIHHRVKNNLQIIKSLLHLQRAKLPGDERAGVFQESIDRVQVMALLHEKLYQSDDLASIDTADYLSSLVDSLSESYLVGGNPIAFELDVEPQRLDLDRAIPLGLLVSEIVTNAIKHAFPGNRSGFVRVAGRGRSGARYCITIADDGVGLPDEARHEANDTLGLKLIHNLSRQLRATLMVTSQGGTCYEVDFEAVPIQRQAELTAPRATD